MELVHGDIFDHRENVGGVVGSQGVPAFEKPWPYSICILVKE